MVEGQGRGSGQGWGSRSGQVWGQGRGEGQGQGVKGGGYDRGYMCWSPGAVGFSGGVEIKRICS